MKQQYEQLSAVLESGDMRQMLGVLATMRKSLATLAQVPEFAGVADKVALLESRVKEVAVPQLAAAIRDQKGPPLLCLLSRAAPAERPLVCYGVLPPQGTRCATTGERCSSLRRRTSRRRCTCATSATRCRTCTRRWRTRKSPRTSGCRGGTAACCASSRWSTAGSRCSCRSSSPRSSCRCVPAGRRTLIARSDLCCKCAC